MAAGAFAAQGDEARAEGAKAGDLEEEADEGGDAEAAGPIGGDGSEEAPAGDALEGLHAFRGGLAAALNLGEMGFGEGVAFFENGVEDVGGFDGVPDGDLCLVGWRHG